MSAYPNVLTPPMDSPESLNLSPCSAVSEEVYYNDCDMLLSSQVMDAPYLSMVEEPLEKFRFRYKSEMAGTHGSLSGQNSDRSRKQTYPTVYLHNWNKPAIVRCSLYQYGREDMAHTRHPHGHRLVKRHGPDEIDDPHHVTVNRELGYEARFCNMGIIHTAKKFVITELIRKNSILKREEIARREHKERPLSRKEELEVKSFCEKEASIVNLNIVCLRFDAFEVRNDIYYPICQPVYSQSINNLKSALTGDLKIVRMDYCSSSCTGGREIFILVEKVTKKNIKVRFFELDDEDNEVWFDYGRFSDLDVHHQYAIVFKTPPYQRNNIEAPVKVYIELLRPSDGARSEPKDFSYTPCEVTMGKKRARYSSYGSSSYSGDLPATIPNFTTGTNNRLENELIRSTVNSDELNRALSTKDLNSAELENICQNLFDSKSTLNSLKTLYNFGSEDLCQLDSISTDGPQQAVDIKPVLKKLRPISRNLTAEEMKIIERIKSQLTGFIRTNPPKNRIKIMLDSFFQDANYTTQRKDNILHLLLYEHDNTFLTIFFELIFNLKSTPCINLQNDAGKTPLHLAVEFDNAMAVSRLLYLKPNLNVQDYGGNTALHLAIMNGSSFDILETLVKVGVNLNLHNNDGLAPLHLAVKCCNLKILKLLCLSSCDLTAIDKKNGYTVLHMAVEGENIDMINFLLKTDEISPMIEDFNQCSVLKLAKALVNNEKPRSAEVYRILEEFVQNSGGVFEQVEIKEEIEDTASDEEVVEMIDIKEEPVTIPSSTSTSLQEKYKRVHCFTEQCLNDVSKLLDTKGTWQNLLEMLDNGSQLKTLNIASTNKPSKSLLNFAVESGDTLLQIRDSLHHLNELEAVELMDKMVLQEAAK